MRHVPSNYTGQSALVISDEDNHRNRQDFVIASQIIMLVTKDSTYIHNTLRSYSGLILSRYLSYVRARLGP